MLWAGVSMLWDFNQASGSVPRIGWLLIGLIAVLTAVLGWVYFSSESGRMLASSTYQTKRSRERNILRIVFASAGLGMALWGILLMLAFVFAGADGVTKMFLPWVLPLLALICAPMAFRWFGR
jgi:hypothetical protein